MCDEWHTSTLFHLKLIYSLLCKLPFLVAGKNHREASHERQKEVQGTNILGKDRKVKWKIRHRKERKRG